MRNSLKLFSCLLITLLCAKLSAFEYEVPQDFPLMGDWQGQWIKAKKGHEKSVPQMAAKLLPVKDGHYRVVILPQLYNRSAPYFQGDVALVDGKVSLQRDGWEVTFTGSTVRGKGPLNGSETEFVLHKVALESPSIGLQAPKGAVVLFDGSSLDAWQHLNDETPMAATWDIVKDVMQVAPRADKANQKKGIGGHIYSKERFNSMRLHVEFRYPVEARKSGQGRSNSGLFLNGIGEIQILNSYTTENYWNECGAIYKRVPAKVNASGPPLEWQAYDVWVELPEGGIGTAYLTVHLNGHILHNKMAIECKSEDIQIQLQDHGNYIQFRNIWLLEARAGI